MSSIRKTGLSADDPVEVERLFLIDLGITRWVYENSVELWKGTYSQAMENAKKFHYENRNILFDYKMMANPKSGFWEIQITTTKPIPVIPDLM